MQRNASPSATALRAHRLRCYLWRFGVLPLAHRLFGADAAAPRVLDRPLFGNRVFVDVTRGNPQRLLYLEGERFIAERALLARLLRTGMRVVDVGANIGYYLVLVEHRVGPTGFVTAIEPDTANFTELQRNVAGNGFGNVELIQAAAGAADGRTSLQAGINSRVIEEGGDSVRLVRLDGLPLGRVDFLKIDVEGYEGHVLAGARALLERDRPILFVEVHPGFLTPPTTVAELLDLMRGLYADLRFFEIHPQSTLGGKIAARYFGRGARPVPDVASLLAACEQQQRSEPFWVVCTPPRPAEARR